MEDSGEMAQAYMPCQGAAGGDLKKNYINEAQSTSSARGAIMDTTAFWRINAASLLLSLSCGSMPLPPTCSLSKTGIKAILRPLTALSLTSQHSNIHSVVSAALLCSISIK